MTEHFEVLDRDGAARLGELRLADPVPTPALIDDVVRDAGSLWSAEREVPAGDPSALTVLPHRGLPRGTPDAVTEAFQEPAAAVDGPSAVVVSPDTVEDVTEAAEPGSVDAYVLSSAAGYVDEPRALRSALLTLRRAMPDDTALYLPGVATPATVALLAYAGVDCVDADAAVIAGTRGRYLTAEGETDLADLDALPCACPACDRPREDFTREHCVEHNERALAAALRGVRERVRTGRLRDYLEGQVRHDPTLTAAFRGFDQEWGYLAERAPVFRGAEFAATTEDALERVEIRRFADRVTSRYEPRFADRPLLLVPCSARKPYSESRSHSRFQDAAGYRAHVVSITSPIGVVPRELELTYPAQHYDAVVTGEWSAGEVEFVSAVLDRYLDRADHPRAVAHVPDEYRPVVECAVADRALDVTYTVPRDGHPTGDDALAALADALAGEEPIPVSAHEAATLRAVADYQFAPTADGDGAGTALFGDATVVGRHPKLRVERDGEQLAALVPEYGLLALTLAGARAWRESDVPTRTVTIDDFVPRGSVLAPGVVDADPEIRVGDEVVVEGPSALAVGRATAHGRAMVESIRGMAVQVRHAAER
ncbi:MAG: archaeosine synthase subunit alpha [Halobacteriaceae archaeon]